MKRHGKLGAKKEKENDLHDAHLRTWFHLNISPDHLIPFLIVSNLDLGKGGESSQNHSAFHSGQKSGFPLFMIITGIAGNYDHDH